MTNPLQDGTADPPPAWLAEIDPRPGPPFLSMGLRGRRAGRWLTPGDDRHRRHKDTVLASHRDEVVLAVPDAAAAAAVRELAATVDADLGDGVGDRRDDPRSAADGSTAASSGAPDLLERTALRVAEDLCLLVRHDGGWVLGAGCVCSPSHWRLADKLGGSMAAVHAPVPHYADELAARVDRFLDRLAPGAGAWRRNWLVHTDDRLFAPVPSPPPHPPPTASDAGERLWLRSELQTLRRLPGADAIVFTIRTDQAPLAVVAARPDLREAMATAVASWDAPLVAYRGGEAVRSPLLAWLSAH